MSINTRRPGVIKNVDADAAGEKKEKVFGIYFQLCV